MTSVELRVDVRFICARLDADTARQAPQGHRFAHSRGHAELQLHHGGDCLTLWGDLQLMFCFWPAC